MSSASDQIVRELLAARGEPCPVCAYDLRHVTEPRCPECGARLEARIVPRSLRDGWWIAGLIGLTLPLGFSTLFLIITLAGAMTSRVSGNDIRMAVVVLGVTVAQVASLRVYVGARGRFARLGPGAQQGTALGAIGLSAVFLIIDLVTTLG